MAGLCSETLTYREEGDKSGIFRSFGRVTRACLCSPGSPVEGRSCCRICIGHLTSCRKLSRTIHKGCRFRTTVAKLGHTKAITASFEFYSIQNHVRALCNVGTPLALLFFDGPKYRTYLGVVGILGNRPTVTKVVTSKELTILGVCVSRSLRK